MADLMNPGGGLTNSKLLLADANPGDVVSPKKFYSNGNKEVQTGTLQERGVETATSTSLYNNDLYYRIPFGAYRTPSGPDNGTEVKASKSAALASASANGTIKIPGLPYARMTTSNADSCSASYSNGTLTVTINENTGEVSGYGNVHRTTNWSITCKMYMT